MSDDLVKRLREYAIHMDAWGKEANHDADIVDEAADRIEKLVAALRHCINALREYEMGDDRPRGPIPNDDLRPWLLGAMDNAVQALDAK